METCCGGRYARTRGLVAKPELNRLPRVVLSNYRPGRGAKDLGVNFPSTHLRIALSTSPVALWGGCGQCEPNTV